MTETHKIRSPEWSDIHERDSRIIELEADVKRLRGENEYRRSLLKEIVERHRLGMEHAHDDLTARLEILQRKRDGFLDAVRQVYQAYTAIVGLGMQHAHDDLTARLEILRCDGEDTVVALNDPDGADVQERFDY